MPPSPTIFNVLIEPLAGLVSQDFYYTTINLFADDVIIFLTNSEISLPAAHNILTEFYELHIIR